MVDIVYNIVGTKVKLCEVGLKDPFAQIEPAGLLDSFGIIFDAINLSTMENGLWGEQASPPVELS